MTDKQKRIFAGVAAVILMVAVWGWALRPGQACEGQPLAQAEEYAVMAAVLFPDDIRATGSNPGGNAKPELDRRSLTLDGITGHYYTLSRFTIVGTVETDNPADRDMAADYNGKNSARSCLDEKMLQPFIPEKGQVTLVDPGIRGESVTPGEITYISRPGFNRDTTMAMLQINHVAGPEMGVGYRVYLEKVAATGKWGITGLELNRMY